jgi:hypothetical protein
VVLLLSPVEQAYLSGTRDFTKPQIRYIKCRLKKKLRRLDEQGCNAAAMLQRLERGNPIAKEKLRTYNSSNEAGQLLVAFVRPQLFFCKRVHWSKSKV